MLDHARIHPTLAEAMEGIDYAFATTARGRELSKPVFTPAAAMDKARRHDGRSAIVFGPERAGLENDDVARANAIVTVPVNPAFPSLNLAQAVLLMSIWIPACPMRLLPLDTQKAKGLVQQLV